jgi:hypothetical protein
LRETEARKFALAAIFEAHSGKQFVLVPVFMRELRVSVFRAEKRF